MDNYKLESRDYYDTIKRESQSLNSKLEKISLSDQEINQITKDKTLRTLKKEGLKLLGPLGEVTSTIMGWHEEMEEEFKKAKEQKLLEGYFIKTEEQTDTINKLKNFVTDPYGFVLFSKIRGILNNTPPDSELIEHLSTVLKNMVLNENFDKLFEDSKYLLAQIDKLTPQALTLIADKKSWPTFTTNMSQIIGGKLKSDFYFEFTQEYIKKKGIKDTVKIERITHSVRELVYLNLLEAYPTENENKFKPKFKCELTSVGLELYKFLT